MTKPLKRLTPSKPADLTERLDQAQDWMQEANTPTGAFPWESAHPRVIVGYSLRMPEALAMKLRFLAEHEPKASMHKIILEGIEREVERRLQKYLNRRKDAG